jgi:HlyD family secretion protein
MVKIILLISAVSVFTFIFFKFRAPEKAGGAIEISGRIEGDDAVVAARRAGRLGEIRVREGDRVKPGQIIAVLDDDQIRAREEQAESVLRLAESRKQRAKLQIAVLNEQLEQSRLSIEQSNLDSSGRLREAEAQVASAEARLAEAEADYEQARYDAEKFDTLARQGVESERIANQARNNAEKHRAAVRAAHKLVDAARGLLITASADLANPKIISSQAAVIRHQILQAQSDIDASQAEIERARAQLKEAVADRNDLFILAPFDATVTTRYAEPGEIVAAGTPILTIVNLGQIYLRGFVPEKDIGHVQIGQSARVYLDSDPDKPIEAIVIRIDPEASFTPENTYFREERVKQVFGVKLLLKNNEGRAKPGIPADGEIILTEQ